VNRRYLQQQQVSEQKNRYRCSSVSRSSLQLQVSEQNIVTDAGQGTEDICSSGSVSRTSFPLQISEQNIFTAAGQ
jgi:hypothetical protein